MRIGIATLAGLVVQTICMAAPQVTTGADPVAILMRTGETRIGVVDSLTNDRALWLHQSSSNMVLRFPIDWTMVQSVQIGNETFTSEQFQRTYPSHATEPPNVFQGNTGPRTNIREPVAISPALAPVPRSLEVWGGPANWDADAAIDGYQVLVAPRGRLGEPIPTVGRVDVTLWARSFHPATHREGLERVGQWSQVVALEDYRHGIAVIRLPTRVARHPTRSLQPIGKLQVRFHHTSGLLAAEAPIEIEAIDAFRAGDDPRHWMPRIRLDE